MDKYSWNLTSEPLIAFIAYQKRLGKTEKIFHIYFFHNNLHVQQLVA